MLLPLAVIILTDPSLRLKLPDIGRGIGLGVLLYIPFGYFFTETSEHPYPSQNRFHPQSPVQPHP
ncbi:MAG: hypothetical protein Kow0021_15560 [Methanothermobacter thermautotrophicus]|jgi:hypothetical protein|nr:truncated conserved hypothetical protein [Methanothermobacter sp. CaT2]